MCGLAGILTFSLPAPEDRREAVRRMLKAQRHRGPDGQGMLTDGCCLLGHTRLAVIDTSPQGAQPMSRQGAHLVYNGELYNFQEKRRLLERDGVVFAGNSDTEVLLWLYLKYGRGCLEHLQGIYAFAIWDSRGQTLFCARDPLGVKPFLYYQNRDFFIFASELKGLLAANLVPRELDYKSLGGLLNRGSVPQPASIIAGVNWLPPGHSLAIAPGQAPKIRQFKKLHARRQPNRASYDAVLQEGRAVISGAVRRQMVADVPLGAFLSGGVDSSLLTALMCREHGDIRTFSVGFEDDLDTSSQNESADAALVAAHLGTRHSLVMITGREVLHCLPDLVRGLDHPTVDGINSWLVSGAASRDLTVAISGTGGDELFAGYPWFEAMQKYASQPWWRRWRQKRQGLDFASVFDAQYRIFDQAAVAALCPAARMPDPRPDPLSRLDVLGRVSGMLLSGYTRDQLLADIDTASMWHGLEVRVPLLDENVLEFALNLPPAYKLGGKNSRLPQGSYAATGVKKILLDLAAPLLPPDFSTRTKRGFILPIDGWLRGILKEPLHDILSCAAVRSRNLFNPLEIQKTLDNFHQGRVHWSAPWLLMMVELWCDHVLALRN
jgi:asparagine synthase (glutamine-hydrolysing)